MELGADPPAEHLFPTLEQDVADLQIAVAKLTRNLKGTAASLGHLAQLKQLVTEHPDLVPQLIEHGNKLLASKGRNVELTNQGPHDSSGSRAGLPGPAPTPVAAQAGPAAGQPAGSRAHSTAASAGDVPVANDGAEQIDPEEPEEPEDEDDEGEQDAGFSFRVLRAEGAGPLSPSRIAAAKGASAQSPDIGTAAATPGSAAGPSGGGAAAPPGAAAGTAAAATSGAAAVAPQHGNRSQKAGGASAAAAAAAAAPAAVAAAGLSTPPCGAGMDADGDHAMDDLGRAGFDPSLHLATGGGGPASFHTPLQSVVSAGMTSVPEAAVGGVAGAQAAAVAATPAEETGGSGPSQQQRPAPGRTPELRTPKDAAKGTAAGPAVTAAEDEADADAAVGGADGAVAEDAEGGEAERASEEPAEEDAETDANDDFKVQYYYGECASRVSRIAASAARRAGV